MQLWPPLVEPATLTSWVHDDTTAQAIPGMARALQVYCGMLGQLELNRVENGRTSSPRPPILDRPDPLLARFNYVGQSVRDWWVHGNALSLVTARTEGGLPAAVRYFPAWQWSVIDGDEAYYLNGRPVDPGDVLHVQRGVDPANPRRGVGVVELHLRTLKRAGLEERYEEAALQSSGVPSVAVIAPQKELTQEEADAAADRWEERFGGTGRRPGVFPNGTEIKPLAWNPGDQELVLARKVTTLDLANLMNLDGYWLGAEGSSHTYRSPGAMFVGLLRVSLEPVMQVFEDVWSRHLVPWPAKVQFYRPALTRDDMGTMTGWGRQAVDGGLLTVNEWRELAGLPRSSDPAADELSRPSAASPSDPIELVPAGQPPAPTTEESEQS